jgi:hypothetical protein
MDWIQFGLLLISIGGMFAWIRSDIALNRSEAAADRRDILQLIRSIQEEIKDFHGRLERQDAEFKARLCAIEERRNK